MTKNSKILEDFQKEIEEMNEDDTRLKVIKELDTILGLIKSKKEKKRKDLGIRNYPESCMESMIAEDDQVHGI